MPLNHLTFSARYELNPRTDLENASCFDVPYNSSEAEPSRPGAGVAPQAAASSTTKDPTGSEGQVMSDVREIGSMDELAAIFEQRADAARESIKPRTPNMRIALLREQARIWEEAARIARGEYAWQ
jgi:hypothetical protein